MINLVCDTCLSHGLKSKRTYSKSGNSYTVKIVRKSNGREYRKKK
jgi:hypothetical protein